MKLEKADHALWALWAADCAARVLSAFEEKSPDEPRPRQAIAAGRAWARGELPMVQARMAALARTKETPVSYA